MLVYARRDGRVVATRRLGGTRWALPYAARAGGLHDQRAPAEGPTAGIYGARRPDGDRELPESVRVGGPGPVSSPGRRTPARPGAPTTLAAWSRSRSGNRSARRGRRCRPSARSRSVARVYAPGPVRPQAAPDATPRRRPARPRPAGDVLAGTSYPGVPGWARTLTPPASRTRPIATDGSSAYLSSYARPPSPIHSAVNASAGSRSRRRRPSRGRCAGGPPRRHRRSRPPAPR